MYPCAGNGLAGLIAVTVLVASARVAEAQGSVGLAGCNPKELGAAVAADTTKLKRSNLDFSWPEATEGASLTVYDARKEPKVIVLRFLGELGQATNAYYLLDARNYVLVRDELQYAAPVDVDPHAQIVSRLPSVLYVCSGKPRGALNSADAAVFMGQLDSAVATFRRSGKH